VGKVRLNASMTQNVVTYTVEITTDNSDGRLLPYLTANVQFQLQQFTNVLQAPNAALRWSPPAEEGSRKKPTASNLAAEEGKSNGFLWVVDENQEPRRIEVQTGASDGTSTMVEGTELHEGMQMITGIRLLNSGNGKDEGGNPFLPNLHRNKKSSTSGSGSK
jgi:HlyD family secretion protein